jgi:hypothetical protein
MIAENNLRSLEIFMESIMEQERIDMRRKIAASAIMAPSHLAGI